MSAQFPPPPQDTSPFSRRNQIGRVLWSLVYVLFFYWSPRPLHGWRAFLLRCFGANIGRRVHVYRTAVVWAPWQLTIGDHCGIGDGARLYNLAPITIGNRTTISQGVHLCTGTHDFEQPGFPLVARPITVGDDAWVAAEAFVHPGVHIADGSVVGARSVVVRNTRPWMVHAGMPARPLRERNRPQEEPAP
ncbi:MAG: WcaF family extracellular polysaccharide biosynthesis acetyltransferase [Opitutales bacterium]